MQIGLKGDRLGLKDDRLFIIKYSIIDRITLKLKKVQIGLKDLR